MKKLAAVIIILTILCATPANAAVDIYVTDITGSNNITMAPSETVDLLIWYEGDLIISFDMAIGSIGPGTLSQPVITSPDKADMYDYIGDGQYYGLDWEIFIVGSPLLLPGIIWPLATAQFHCDDVGQIVIEMMDLGTYDENWGHVFPTIHGMTINQIPEPTTISLLCLGAFIIKRRK